MNIEFFCRFSLVLSLIGQSVFAGSTCMEAMSHNSAFTTSQEILKDSNHVSINIERMAIVAKKFADSAIPIAKPSWNFPPYPTQDQASASKMFKFFVVLDAINFRYIDGENKQTYADPSRPETGAGLLVQRLWAAGDLITNGNFLRSLSTDMFEHLVHAQVPLPDIEGRVAHLRQVGQFFVDFPELDSNDGLSAFLAQFDDALALAEFLSNNIVAYQDKFLKRAQLAVGMFVGRFHLDPDPSGFLIPKNIKDVSRMTVYADYILPMILFKMGILEYSEDLRDDISRGRELTSGSPKEAQIRAATVVASALLLEELKKFDAYSEVDSLDLDAILWLQAKEIPVPEFLLLSDDFFLVKDSVNHHFTMTRDY